MACINFASFTSSFEIYAEFILNTHKNLYSQEILFINTKKKNVSTYINISLYV